MTAKTVEELLELQKIKEDNFWDDLSEEEELLNEDPPVDHYDETIENIEYANASLLNN